MISGSQRVNDLGRPLASVSSASSFTEIDDATRIRHEERVALLDSDGEPTRAQYGAASSSDLGEYILVACFWVNVGGPMFRSAR